MVGLREWFSTGGDFASQEIFDNFWRHFQLFQLESGVLLAEMLLMIL